MKDIYTNLPKRQIKKTFRSVTGFFPSVKNSRSMAFESLLEKQLFLSLEFDSSVKTYLEQPIKIEYKVLKKSRSYHPDCLVEYHNGREKLIEVKYTTDLEKFAEKLEVKFNAAREYTDKNDMEFDIFTEKNISSIQLSNFTFLYAFATFKVSEETIKKIQLILKQHNTMTVSELLNALTQSRYEQAKLLPSIWKMIFDGKLQTDYDNSELTMGSVLKQGSL